jgi:hypothetical protein
MTMFRIAVFLSLVLLLSNVAIAQKPFAKEIKELSRVRSMPYDPELSGDPRFWNAVACKLEIIPSLIDAMADPRETKANVYYFGGRFAVGDVAFHAITEIIRGIPTLNMLEDWDGFSEAEAFGNYWRYVRESIDHRQCLQAKIRQWFSQHSTKLVWIPDTKRYPKTNEEGAATYPHPAGGYYQLPANGN